MLNNKCIATFFSVFLLLIFQSCKIGYSFNGASIPADAKTVSVQYFPSYATLAGPLLSQNFTETLKDFMASQTKLNLTDRNADMVFEGSITGYSTSPVAIQSNDQAALNRLTITINVKFTNGKDEKKSFEQSFSRFADYPSSQSLSSVENDLIKTINKQLVEDIFNKAFNNW